MRVLCIDQELATSLNFVSRGLLEMFSALSISRKWVLVSLVLINTSQLIVQHIVHYFLHAHLFFPPQIMTCLQGGGALDNFLHCALLSHVALFVKFTSMPQLKI
jgi:hypothetical protein